MIDFGKANLPTPGVDSVELVFHIPWGHNKLIIDKCKNNQEKALFCVGETTENNWNCKSNLNSNITKNYEL